MKQHINDDEIVNEENEEDSEEQAEESGSDGERMSDRISGKINQIGRKFTVSNGNKNTPMRFA